MVNPLNLISIGSDLADHVMTLGAFALAVWGYGRRIYKKHLEERESAIRLRKGFLVVVDQLRQTQDVVRLLAESAGWNAAEPTLTGQAKRKIDNLTDFLYQAEGNEGHRGAPDTGLSMYELRSILAQSKEGAQ